MHTKRKGTANEHKSRRLLEAAGYAVTRAAGSLGAWDLIGISATDGVLVQVKSNSPPSPAERATLAAFVGPPHCTRVIHVWRDRQRVPEIRVLP